MAMHCNRRGECRQIHLTRHFSHALLHTIRCACSLHGSRRAVQRDCMRASFLPHVILHERLIVRSLSVSSCLSFSCFSSSVYLFSSTLYLHSDQHFLSNVNSVEGINHCAFAQWGLLPHGDIPSSHRLWAQRSWRLPLLRDFCNDLPGWIRRHWYGALVLVWRGTRRWDHRKSAIFTTVRSGARRTSEPETSLITLMKKVCCQLSPFFTHTRTGRPVHELSSCQERKSSREMENERIRILLERQKEQILAEVRTVIQKHEFQANSDGRSIQELSGIVESRRREIEHTTAGDEQLRRDQVLLHQQLSEQNRDLREAHIKSLHEMEELKRVQELRIDESSRKNWSKIETLSLNSQPRFRNPRTKQIPRTIREILKMLTQYAVDYPTFPVNQRCSHLFEILAEC